VRRVSRQPRRGGGGGLDVVFPRCAGLDVHTKSITACRLVPDPIGQEGEGSADLKTFGPRTRDVLALAGWLTEASLTPLAMASTGEDWKPVDNLLEATCTVLLVNATHVKTVPGRQTDKAAARWLATRMRVGLLQASFIPPKAQRDLRELTRYRPKLVQERGREVKRVQGVVERANLKRASVLSAGMGVSGRARLEALIAGRADPATMAELAQRRMRTTIPLLEQALPGVVHDHHRQLLARPRAHIDFLDAQIEALTRAMVTSLKARSTAEPPREDHPPLPAVGSAPSAAVSPPLTVTRAVARLDPSPGIDHRGAEVIGAEIGSEMARFETAPRLAAWAGVAPGHDESAGQQRAGQTRTGNRPLRALRTQLAHAAVQTKDTSLSALYQRLAARRGKKRAIIAVAHASMVSVLHLLSRQEPYRELGANYCDERRRQFTIDRLTRRIAPLGYRVHLEPVTVPAV
jgi:transposase